MLKKGDKAIDFLAVDQNGEKQSLEKYQGSWILLYFYPKDDTPGCTKEACSFRDIFPDLTKADVKVLGISKDSVSSHQKFSQKYQLPFSLLADENKEIIKKYKADGIFKRISYLINPKGYIAKSYPRVKPEEHAQEVLNDLIMLQRDSET